MHVVAIDTIGTCEKKENKHKETVIGPEVF